MNSRVRTTPTRRGIRISQHGTVLSEILAQPGPSHSVVDVMAAAICAFAPGPRIALLGFEGGGLVAPLRALGSAWVVEAVDLSDRSYGLFQTLCGPWCGSVAFHLADAAVWLKTKRAHFDMVVEDLSVSDQGEVIKPELTWTTLPRLVQRSLKPGGLALFNLLRPEERTWKSSFAAVARPFPVAHIIHLGAFENCLVLAGDHSLRAQTISRGLTQQLRRLGSRLAKGLSVASLS